MNNTIIAISLFVLSFSVKAQIPDIQLKSATENKWINLSDLQGEKLTVVDFWATWCKPCVAALPKLNALSKEFETSAVQFIGINVDGPRNRSKVLPFIKTQNLSYPILLDPDSKLMNELNAHSLPTLIIFNNKGKIVYTHEGFSNGEEIEIRDKIKELLKK